MYITATTKGAATVVGADAAAGEAASHVAFPKAIKGHAAASAGFPNRQASIATNKWF
jgi:hypothetical protein